ncbi:unnamed protein product [Phytophthora fragariaefolia]|uniref:Unnamed protein product n=1 Tax=Phytophthora fragariaefolia TaxID=1490495 RepID=A0A9W6TN05_9STRA|nr:unnamed protein product [Phytophthora fragariaefolia]
MMAEDSSKSTPGAIQNGVESGEQPPQDTLLDEFRESQPARQCTINSNSRSKTFATPGFLECDCVAATKRGLYNETVCGAHNLTLRNSRPHLESIEFSQKVDSLAGQNSTLPKSLGMMTTSRHVISSKGEELDSVLLRASKSTSSLRQQHDFASEPIISLLPILHSKSTGHVRSESGEAENVTGRNAFSLSMLTLDTPTILPLQEAQEMLELYNKIIRVNNQTQKNMAVMYTRRSTLLAAMGKYLAALQDSEQVLKLDPKSTVVRTCTCLVLPNASLPVGREHCNFRDTTVKVVRCVDLAGLQKQVEHSNRVSRLMSIVDTCIMDFSWHLITRVTAATTSTST